MPASFSGQTLFDSIAEWRNIADGQPVPPGLALANGIIVPAGPAPARGYILLTRAQLVQLDLNSTSHTLAFSDGLGNVVTLNSIVFINARNINPGGTADPTAVYLCEVSDARWLCHNPTFQIPINRQYNVNAPGYGDAYYLDTMQVVSQQTGTPTLDSTSVTSLTSTSMLLSGMVVSGTGILPGTTIASIGGGTSIVLSAAAIASSPATMTFYVPWTWNELARCVWNVLQKVQLVSTQNGTLAVASASVTGLTSTTALAAGMVVTGTGILPDTYIVSVDSATQVTISPVASAAGAQSLSFYSGPLGGYPTTGLPVSPDGLPEDWRWPGTSAWQAINQVIYRCGCVVSPDLRKVAGKQFAIAQIGATDQATETLIAQLDASGNKVFDEEWIEGTAAKVPYGVRVFFHRKQDDAGTEETTPLGTAATTPDYGTQFITNAAYSVDVVGPDTLTTRSGIYHPIWDDLPALYDAAGVLQNGPGLATRAAELSADFYRMLRSVGGSRLRKWYGKIVGFVPGGELKGVAWRQWTKADGGWITEVVRHPWKMLRGGDDGQWIEEDMGSVAIQPRDLRPGLPVYPTTLHEIIINSSTPKLWTASSATKQAGGSGYSVNDVLTLSGGTSTTAAQFKVTTVSGGAVTGLSLVTAGSYSVKPSNPVSVTGGGGSSCTLNVVWAGQFDAYVERRDPAGATWANREPCWAIEINGATNAPTQRYPSRGPVGFRDGRPTYLFLNSSGAPTLVQVSSVTVTNGTQPGNIYVYTSNGDTFSSAGATIRVKQVNGYVLNTSKYLAAWYAGVDASGNPVYETTDHTGLDGSGSACDSGGTPRTWVLENGIVKSIS